jgi:hypothetical protein
MCEGFAECQRKWVSLWSPLVRFFSHRSRREASLVLWAAFGHNPFFEDREEKDFGFATIVDEDFGDVPSIDVNNDDHDVGVQEWS